MRCNKALLILAAAFVGFAGSSASAQDTLAGWTFESSLPTTSGPHTAELGLFALTSGASSNAGGTFSNPAGNGSAESFSSNGWNAGEYYQFQTSSVGYESLLVSYGQAGSSTGPRDFTFLYSADGTSFTQLGAIYDGPDTDFTSATFQEANVLSFDLSSITSLHNADSVFFRVAVSGTTSENGGTIASTGTFRIDDFIVQASAVPEPGSLGVLSLCAVALLRRRRA